MKAGNVIAFILPFNSSAPSAYVRARCLSGYSSNEWGFEFIGGNYPSKLNFPVARRFYREFYTFKKLLFLKYKNKKLISLIVKPNSIVIILIIRYILRIHVIVDINDPLHLPEFNGHLKTLLILKLSNFIIFESPEYRSFWKLKKLPNSAIIEDTPQHECIYTNYIKRNKDVIWVGSPETSKVLLDFIPHLTLFNALGFRIKILGGSSSVIHSLICNKIKLVSIDRYDNNTLLDELAISQISFIPMPNIDIFNLRGNLKAKISMGCGCLTIASKNAMHDRLITNHITGIVFEDYGEFSAALDMIIKNPPCCSEIATRGNIFVSSIFTRRNHAKQIIEIANEIC